MTELTMAPPHASLYPTICHELFYQFLDLHAATVLRSLAMELIV